ncbi:MAG: glycosyltransferase, partial [Candidatus Omnitrophica bacterium]|nr:glycosyltransferase [Candidatus Omnitrophota bacterium]
MNKVCDIIIPVWNQLDCTKRCIEHIVKNTRYPIRLILVDNGSDSETKHYLESLKKNLAIDVCVIRNEENLGFIRAVNHGFKVSKAGYVCVMNNDTAPGVGWLTELVMFAEKHPDTGLLNPLCNGHTPRGLTINEYARKVAVDNKGCYMEMNQCQGFCMLIKRELIEKIGHLDESFGIGGFDDTDYSMRAHKAGYRSVCLHSSYVFHEEHISFNNMGKRKKIQASSEKEYFKKWSRHLRIAILFSVSMKTNDNEISNLLKIALFLARDWCWVNLLIFGDRNTKKRIDAVKEKISFPLHQNIKFNYLNRKIRILEIIVRILERAIGTKRRKRYDHVIYDNIRPFPLLNGLCAIQGCGTMGVDFSSYEERRLEKMLMFCQGGSSHQDIKCDIILPVYGQFEVTKKCVERIVKNTDTPFRLIIVNNGKDAETRKLLEDLKKNDSVETVILHNDHNIGWVKALNRAIDISDAPYICFQNNDTIVTRGWLRKMINILRSNDKFGIINPTWEDRPDRVSIEKYNTLLEKKGQGRFIETDWCRGFSAVIKREVVEKIGHVDERYGIGYFDDVDYSVSAIESGFIVVRALDTYVYHQRNVSFFEVANGSEWNEMHEKNKSIYYKKWGKPLRIALVLDSEIVRNEKLLHE